MKTVAYLLAFLSFLPAIQGQTDCDTIKSPKLLWNSFQCKWQFLNLTDTIQGIIIKHEQQTVGCGTIATASLTIIKTANDTIRVLDLCNLKDYKTGQRVKIVTETAPNFQVHIPSYTLITGYPVKKRSKKEKEEQKKKIEIESKIFRSNEFDERVLKTTWGEIIPFEDNSKKNIEIHKITKKEEYPGAIDFYIKESIGELLIRIDNDKIKKINIIISDNFGNIYYQKETSEEKTLITTLIKGNYKLKIEYDGKTINRIVEIF